MKKLMILVIAVLVAWNSWLTYAQLRSEETVEEEEQTIVDESGTTVVENTVNGYTTDITETVETVQPRLVTVTVEEPTGNTVPGSGMIYKVTDNGTYIVTSASILENYALPEILMPEESEEEPESTPEAAEEAEESEEEVVEEELPAASITVCFDNSISVQGELVGLDQVSDIAVVLVHPDFGCVPVSLGDDSILKQGEYAIAMSGRYPSVGRGVVSFGVVSEPLQVYYPATEKTPEAILSTLKIDIGHDAMFTGGVIVNLSGDVVGVLRKETGLESGMSSAVSISEVKTVAEQLILSGSVTRTYLGVTGRNVSDLQLYEKSGLQITLDVTDGILVESVQPGSPAEKAGIKDGDVLQKIGDQTLTELKDLQNYLYGDIPLIPQKIVLLRNGSTITVEAIMYEELPEEPAEETE